VQIRATGPRHVGAEAFDLEFFATQFFIDKYGYRSHQTSCVDRSLRRRSITKPGLVRDAGRGLGRRATHPHAPVGARLGRFDRAALLGDARFRGWRP